MDKHKMSEMKTQQQIEEIVEIGMSMYEPFPKQVWNMYRQVGLRHLFKDSTEILFLGLVMSVLLFVLFTGVLSAAGSNDQEFYSYIFTLSPIIYFGFVAVFFIWKQQQMVAEIEMTTTYNLYQLAALRMLLFSIVSLVINSISIVLSIVISTFNTNGFSILFAIVLAASSLFVFAALLLRILIYSSSSLTSSCVFCLGWIAVNGLLIVQNVFSYERLLSEVPLAVYGIIILASVYLFYQLLKQLFQFKSSEGVL